jgi:hypothetical protein
MRRIFIIPGDISHLAMIAAHIGDRVCGILLHQRADATRADLERIGLEDREASTFSLGSLNEVGGEPITRAEQDDYARALQVVLADPRAHYLATRSRLDSPFNNALSIERAVLNSLRIIRSSRPSCLVASSAPHSMEAWVFAKCFESCGLPIYILEATPIAYRAWIYRGLESQDVVPLGTGDRGRELSEATLALVRAQRESRPDARDDAGYRVSRIYLSSIEGSQTNRWWSWRREIRHVLRGKLRSMPLRLHSSWRKRQLHASYRSVEVASLPAQPFVVYFMHYQPERSSLPVGQSFSQQWLAIRALASALPAGWKLLVREHPTTWLRPLDPFVRTRSIYEDIASLAGTALCSMDIDTFELVDRASAVATLTGSVGFQALIRRKPVLALGLAPYKDHPACCRVTSIGDAADALARIASGECTTRLTDAEMEAYLAWIERNSVCIDPAEPDWMRSRLKNFAEIYRRLLQGDLELDHRDPAMPVLCPAAP